jgi:hypothetical protein
VTINPAIQLGIDDRVGSLEPGKDADFVIWSGYPLSTFARAEQTWIDGRKYFDIDDDAEARLSAIAERSRLIQKVLEERLGDEGPPGDEEQDDNGETPDREKRSSRRATDLYSSMIQSSHAKGGDDE